MISAEPLHDGSGRRRCFPIPFAALGSKCRVPTVLFSERLAALTTTGPIVKRRWLSSRGMSSDKDHSRLPLPAFPTAKTAVAFTCFAAPWGLSPASFEILHSALVFLSLRPGGEGAEITPSPGPRVDLARIEPILTGLQFSDHYNQPLRIPTSTHRGNSPESSTAGLDQRSPPWADANGTNAAARAPLRPRLRPGCENEAHLVPSRLAGVRSGARRSAFTR